MDAGKNEHHKLPAFSLAREARRRQPKGDKKDRNTETVTTLATRWFGKTKLSVFFFIQYLF
ncbi:hypothetical protein M1525_00685 [Patescibacteria group bacterium]|nr:hypothetical protein [Patescibacteria group bacterium]